MPKRVLIMLGGMHSPEAKRIGKLEPLSA